MSSTDDRQNSAPGGKKLVSGAMRLPGLVSQMSPVEQLPFPNSAYTPTPSTPPTSGMPFPPAYQSQIAPMTTMTTPLTGSASASGVTRQLSEYNSTQETPGASGEAVTRQLSNTQTGMLPVSFARTTTTTTALRQPVVIRGTGKRSTETLHAPRRRRWVVHIAVTCILALIVLASVLSVIPTGSGGSTSFNPFRPIMNFVQSNGSNPALIAQQAATATAVITHQDGFDPGQNSVGAGIPPPVISSGSTLNRFAFGQCTYWANMRYHALTGYWVPWLGNAYQWAYGARASGWVVSATPKVPSIIVLQPGVQGAGGYGHVAIVERINSDGSVYASNYNWYANGGWDTLSYWTFRPGSGVSFVWHP
jgi:surface antigen